MQLVQYAHVFHFGNGTQTQTHTIWDCELRFKREMKNRNKKMYFLSSFYFCVKIIDFILKRDGKIVYVLEI